MRVHNHLLAGALVAVAACLAVVPAIAQTTFVPAVAVVEDPTTDTEFADIPESQKRDNLVDAVALAKTLDSDQTITVFLGTEDGSGLDYATWTVTETITIGPDDDLEIIGAGRTSGNYDGPSRVVVTAGGGSFDVFTVDLPGYPVLIENLTIQGGDNGVKVVSAADVPVVLSRCYIRSNGEHGVLASDESRILVANCMIRDNGMDGVHLIDDAYAAVLFCTIFGHTGDAGVFIDNDAFADVRNCLVFENGNGLEDSSANDIASDYNNVGANTINNFLNVTPGTRDKQLNPITEPAADPPFIVELDPAADRGRGKLLSKGDFGPPPLDRLVGEADIGFLTTATSLPAEVSLDRFLAIDIEGDPRPSISAGVEDSSGYPDIGADEEFAGAATGYWFFVEVAPPDEDAYIIGSDGGQYAAVGRMEAGDLRVEVRMSGADPTAVFLLPQGADDPTDVDQRIPLRPIASSAGYWLGTNDIDIEREIDAGGTVITTDGHAAVYVDVGGTIIGGDPASPSGMSEQVQKYRHTLIDTIPPRLRLLPASATPLASPPLVSLLNLPADGYQGAYGATLTAGIHPTGLPAFPSDWRPGLYLNAPQFSFDDGLITDTPGTSKGTQAFFNVASLSNVFVNERLHIQVLAEFTDVAPSDAGVDRFTNSTSSRASGFPPDASYPSAEDVAAGLRGYETGPGQWKFGDNAGLPSDVYVEYETTGTAEGEGGYDFGNPTEDQTGSAVDVDAPLTTAAWTFYTLDPANDGIARTGGEDHLHMSIQFVPKDRAGNQAQIEVILDEDETLNTADLALDPLHIWWTDEARTQILPKLEGQQVVVNRALFRYQLRRGYDPAPAGNDSRPLYTHRIWWNPVPASGVVEYNDPYSPVTGWSDWSTTGIITEDEFAGLEGHWVLMVTIGADEAGNVEQWPADLVLGAGDVITGFGAATGSNWQRVYIKDPESELDTAASARFYHEINGRDTAVGSGNLAPVPEDPATVPMYAMFSVVPTFPSAPAAFEWTLTAETGETISGTVSWPDVGASGQTVQLQVADTDFPVWPTADRPKISYVFRAATTLDTSTTDQTPANVQFTLIYGPVGDYLNDPRSKEDQPIKEQQTL